MAGERPRHGASGEPGGRRDLYEDAAMPYTPEPAHGTPDRPQVDSIRARHERTLLAIRGVVGVGVGRTPIGDDAIVVYLSDASMKQHIPSQLEGYPVETVVTGEIDAYGRARPR